MLLRDILKGPLLLVGVFCAAGQTGRAQQGVSTEAVLRLLTQSAAVVFAGEVISVRRPEGFAGSGQDASEGMVTIEFRVDEAVRGSTGGSVYTVREWAGLWTGGDRYHVGQRLLIFLHGPGRDGLSSPVGGQVGMVPLRGGGRAPGPYDAATGDSEWVVDLRLVQAQAARAGLWNAGPETDPLRPARPPVPGRMRGGAASDGLIVTTSIQTASLTTDPFPPVDETFASARALPPATGPAMQPLSQVLGLCRGWVKASDGAL